MSILRTNARDYILGNTPQEQERLRLQASIVGGWTESYLVASGLGRGMHVLDLGSGMGDVALLAAEIVGPSGSVIGIDRDGVTLEKARERSTAESDYSNVHFIQSELLDFHTEQRFDAVIGRYILLYQPDPVKAVRHVAEFVRHGGIWKAPRDVFALKASKPDKEFPMAVQNDQKSLRPNEQQGSSMQRSPNEAGIASRRRSPVLGFGITPQEFFNSNPFSLMRRMTEEMDRVIQEFGLERGEGNRTGWSPAIEVEERDGKYSVRAELPGLSPNDVKVEVTNDALLIQGERKVEQEEKEGGMRRTERQYGLFYRSIPLPEGADVEHASAKFENGLLEVTVPVPQQQQQRHSIPIQGETKAQPATSRQAA